ncbi:MAG: leucine-rich repeat protein [Spirochaetaceae bacterium]|nr:leucine-rich repeat protein [Spirochaetaceae bacterium]
MPYSDENGYGYINAGTFEVVIPAQYKEALPFVGPFALVQDIKEKLFIIDKSGAARLTNFDDARLFLSEDEETVFAMTTTDSGFKKNPNWSLGDALFNRIKEEPFFIPRKHSFNIYNLNSGTRVARNFYSYRPRSSRDLYETPDFFVAGNYLVCENQLFTMGDQFVRSGGEAEIDALIAHIKEDRGIDYMYLEKRGSYELRTRGWKGDYSRREPLTFNNEQISFDVERLRSLLSPDAVLLDLKLVNLDPFMPLVKKDPLYSVTYGRGKEEYSGLYNAAGAEWEIRPFNSGGYRKFRRTQEEAWFSFSDSIYSDSTLLSVFNSDTQKKYTGAFCLHNNFYASFPYLVYQGDSYGNRMQNHQKEGDFEYTVKDGEITILGFTDITADMVIIPARIQELPVTGIGDHAFRQYSSLESIVIPAGVKSIGPHAFERCSGLLSITLPEELTELGYNAFSGCTGLREVTLSRKTVFGRDVFPQDTEIRYID